MKPNYYDVLFNDFESLVTDAPMDLNIQKLYREGYYTCEIYEELKGDKDPIVLLSLVYDYITDGSIISYNLKNSPENGNLREIDEEKEYPIKADLLVIIATRDMAKSQVLEEYILRKYKDERIICVPYPYDENMYLEIRIQYNPQNKVTRTKGDNRLVTGIKIECKGCVMFEETYSPIEAAFDDVKQHDAIKRILAFNNMSRYYTELSLKDEVIGEEIDTYREKSERMKQLAEELRKSTEIIDDEYADPYYISEIYETYINDKSRDLRNAIKELEMSRKRIDRKKEDYYNDLNQKIQEKDKAEKERIQKEKDRIRDEELNKIKLQSHGDAMINIFTDAVVREIKSKFNYEIPIYGGSTYMEYFKNEKERALNYPAILVKTDTSYATDMKTYVVTKQDGSNVTRWYDFITSIPFGYGVTLCINYKKDTKEYARQIKDYLEKVYANPITIYVNNPMEAGTYLPITLCVDKSTIQNQKLPNSNNLASLISEAIVTEGAFKISFIKYCSVYYSYKISKEDIYCNPQGQIALLKQLLYVKDYLKQLENILSKELPNGYKTLITGQNASWEYRRNRAYVVLRRKYLNHEFIDRPLFDDALKPIVDYYPPFYEKVMSGWVYNQIEQDIRNAKKVFEDKYTNISSLLGFNINFVEKLVLGNDYIDFKSDEAIEYYIKEMSSKNLDIGEARRDFEKHEKAKKKKLEEQRIKAEMEREERAYYQSQYGDQSYDGGSSSGGSFIRDTAAVAVGNIIANKVTKPKKDDKVDLLGSSGCIKGKKDKSGFTQSCNWTCPLYNDCIRGRGY